MLSIINWNALNSPYIVLYRYFATADKFIKIIWKLLFLLLFPSAKLKCVTRDDFVFMVRISHTTCRVRCWEMEWMSEVVLEIHVSQCMSVRQRSSRSCCSADLSGTEKSWQAFRLLCVIAKVPHHCSQREFFQKAPLYFHTGVLIKSLFLHVAVTERSVQPLCSKCSKAAWRQKTVDVFMTVGAAM